MKNKILIASCFAVVFMVLCCKKMNENKLSGTWTLAQVAGSDSLETWSFNDGNQLIRTRFDTVLDTAFYFFEGEFNKSFISIYNLDGYTDGNYDIKELTRKTLILEQKSPYIRKEFYK
ncbi:MAG: hypothetical protein KJ607_06695 [Bacteroidetes bacterium]|nr:hypothetical protein [Bacteroidota bacterium]